jgi:myo-inositol-1(or 4)-monophosphatase
MIHVAIKAAKAAAEILRENFGKLSTGDIRKKSQNDFLTFVDEASEQKIIRMIQQAFPAHAILAEESGHSDQTSEYEWIIDPLDGTKNYISGIPVFAVSIGLRYRGKMKLGVVHDPIRGDIFHAVRNQGAYHDGRKMNVSQRSELAGCLIATGFPFKRKEILANYLSSFKDIFLNCSGVRRMGAAALDLAYLAAGRFDGFWEVGLSPWDMAAGSLLIEEAGGLLSDFWGKDGYLENGYILASNGRIHDFLLDITKTHFPQTDNFSQGTTDGD